MPPCALKYIVFASLALLACTVSPALAIDIPRTAEADTVRRQAESLLQNEPSLTASPSTPGLAVEIPKNAEKVTFILRKVIVEGNSVYSEKQLAAFYRDEIGRKISLADMYILAGRIAQRYLADGYVLSTAYLPQQKIEHGVVHIHVVEGYISSVRLKGDPLDSSVAHKMIDRLLLRRPLKGRGLESIMLMLNELPSVSARAAILPADRNDADGAVTVEITIARTRISAEFDVNDYASRYLGVWQSDLQANLNGILTPVDRLSLNLSSSLDPRFSRYGRAEYLIPFTSSGTEFKLGASQGNSHPVYTLEPLDVRSKSDTMYMGIFQPLIRERAQSLTVSGQFNVESDDTDVLGSTLHNDRLRMLQITAAYNLADAQGGTNILSADIFRGLNILDATKTGYAALSPVDGHSDFTRLDINASRLQELGHDFSLFAATSGQWSSAALIASQEFGYGGPQFGRAYDLSELSGDDGIAFSVELRYDHALFKTSTIQPYLFYDVGKVWSRTEDVGPESAASAGGGFRTRISEWLHTDVYIAEPLTHTPATPKLGSTNNDPRFGISFGISY